MGAPIGAFPRWDFNVDDRTSINVNIGSTGTVSATLSGSSSVSITGTVTASITGTPTVNIGATNTVQISTQSAASSNPIGSVSLGSSTGKTLSMQNNNTTTTSTTATQTVLTYTVASGQTFYLEYLHVSVDLTALSITGTLMGNWFLESPAGTTLITKRAINPTTSEADEFYITFPEPLPIAASTVIRVTCTPSSTTSTFWQANFGGYTKAQ